MGGKREVPPFLRKVLTWDVKVTEQLHFAFVKTFGPLKKHETSLRALEITGHGMMWLVLCVVAVFASSDLYVRHLAINLLIAQVFDLILVSIIKASTRRRRPAPMPTDPFYIDSIDKFSFPSGHASRAAMIVALISMQYDLFFLVEAILYFWFMAICIGRLLQRRHHLLDIIGGLILGWFEALVLMFSGLWLSPASANAMASFFLDESTQGASFDV